MNGTAKTGLTGRPPASEGTADTSLERQVRMIAGVLVLAGVMLGLHVHPMFHLVTALTGAALVWAGAADGCGLGLLLARAAKESAADRQASLSM